MVDSCPKGVKHKQLHQWANSGQLPLTNNFRFTDLLEEILKKGQCGWTEKVCGI